MNTERPPSPPLLKHVSESYGFIFPVLEFAREALPSLIEIFHELDADQSGLITHGEVENAPVPSLVFRRQRESIVTIAIKMSKNVNLFPEVSILPPRVLDALCIEHITDIFDFLDVDGTGQLSQMEFVEGLLQLCLLDA